MPPKKDKGKEKMVEEKSSKEKYRRVTPKKEKKEEKKEEKREESERSRRARRRGKWNKATPPRMHRPIGDSAGESTSEEESIEPEKEQRRTGNLKANTIRSIKAAKRRQDISEYGKNLLIARVTHIFQKYDFSPAYAEVPLDTLLTMCMTEVDQCLYSFSHDAFERPRQHSERYIKQNEERIKAYEAQIKYMHELSKRIKEADKNRQQYIDIIDRKLASALNSHK